MKTEIITNELDLGIVLFYDNESEFFKTAYLRICEGELSFDFSLKIIISLLAEDGTIQSKEESYSNTIE